MPEETKRCTLYYIKQCSVRDIFPDANRCDGIGKSFCRRVVFCCANEPRQKTKAIVVKEILEIILKY
jgi:hypothetical protein